MRPPVHDREIDPPPSWVRRIWETPWVWLAIVVPLFCAPLFIGLDRTDLDNDEAIYSFAVETMLADGDWLTPKSIPSDTSAFLEKPPLKFWLTAAPIRLGLLPQNEFGLRFADAAFGALAFLYVFGIGRRLGGPVCGLAALVLLFTHDDLIHVHGLRSNNMESTTVLAYAAGVYHFMAWRSVNPDVKRHIYAMSLWFVLAFMTKFVAAAFLPVILGIGALLKREDRARLYRDWPTFLFAGLLAVALITPWFVYQYFARGPRLFDIMFGAHVVKRFTVFLDPAHLQPWHFYFTQVWADLADAGTRTLVVAGGLLLLARVIRRRWVEGAVVALWFALPMAAISAGTSKLYHYAYPFLPPVALAGGLVVALVAKWTYRWLAPPFAVMGRWRESALPRLLGVGGAQIVLTAIGFAALVVAGATAVFDRLQAAVGGMVLRNSSVMRPAVVAGVTWLVGAPTHVLRGGVVGGLVMIALPIAAYQASSARSQYTYRPMQALRDCLTPIATAEVARGEAAPGVLVEAHAVTWVPFYYLRRLGPWQQGDTPSDETVVQHLLAPNAQRLVLMSHSRYREFMTRLAVDRQILIDRAARLAVIDPVVLNTRLQQIVIGILMLPTDTFILPGPYAACGAEQVRLVSQ